MLERPRVASDVGGGARRSSPARRAGSRVPSWTTCSRRWPTWSTSSRPTSPGHSRGVANLAAEAARLAGLSDAERDDDAAGGAAARPRPARCVERDLGQAGTTHRHRAGAGAPAPLPHRQDAGPDPGSAPSREIAARHHERLDGSGYPRGLTAASLTPSGPDPGGRRRLPRDDRAAPASTGAHAGCGGQGAAGRGPLPGVSTATRSTPYSGPRDTAHRPDAKGPAGLTAREVEVLGAAGPRPGQQGDRPRASASPRRRCRTTSSTSTPSSAWAAAPAADAVRHPARLVGSFEPDRVAGPALAAGQQDGGPERATGESQDPRGE